MTAQMDPILTHLKHCLPRLAPLLEEGKPMQQLALDSMDTVELLCAVHHEFGVRLTDAEFNPNATLEELSAQIAAKMPN